MRYCAAVGFAFALGFFCGCDNAGTPPESAPSDTGTRKSEKRESGRLPPPRQSGAASHDGAAKPPGASGARGKTPPRADGGAKSENNGRPAGTEGARGGSAGGGRGGAGGRGSGNGGSAARGGNGASRSGGGNSEPGAAHEPPANWLESDVKSPPPPEKRQIWALLIEEIRRLTVARSIEFAPLGASGTSLHRMDETFRFTGRCIITDADGSRRACSFAGEMHGNNYDVSILSINFSLK